ncbi:hypothetical protein J7643_01310 [bacterium]|nr:hypothetical protein [bacterium]
MKKTLTASLATLGVVLGGCALAGLSPTPHSEMPASRAVAQALLGDRAVTANTASPSDPERLATSYRALTEALEKR